jgi:hypothetical protein
MKGDSGSGLMRAAHSPYHAGGLKTERFLHVVGKAIFVAVHLHIS